MSFSSQVKDELCRITPARDCLLAECLGVVLYCNTFSAGEIRVITESHSFAQRLVELFRKAFDVRFDQLPDPNAMGKLTLSISDRSKLHRVFDAFGYDLDRAVSVHINWGLLEEDACRAAFLRGAFLAGGSVTDPDKRYHLELVTSHWAVHREMIALLMDMDFAPKETDRSGSAVLYFKLSNSIEDLLTCMGAPISAMRIMEAKVEKDLRNAVNRRVNCDAANMGKVVDAAQEQLAAIEKLKASDLWETLPEKLRQTAELRQANPEATLTELSELCQPKISKSAMNHRLRKLLELAH